MTQMLEFGLKTDNPCAAANITPRLTSLRRNVGLDLALIHQYYPNVPVMMTGYFNPLGAGTGLLLPTGCPLVTAAFVTPLVLTQNWKPLFRYLLEVYVRETNHIPGSPPQNVYTDAIVSAFSIQVLARLNSTLSSIASTSQGVTFVPLSFGANGLCSVAPLIFQPQVDVSFVIKTPFIPDSSSEIKFGFENTCTGPKDPFENAYTKTGSGTISLVAGQVLDYTYSLKSNCVPHPTKDGQISIANQLQSHVP